MVKAGEWYQSTGFGSEWLTTYEVPATAIDPTDPNASATVRKPVVTGGVSQADKAGNKSVVATKTYDGNKTIVYETFTGDVTGVANSAAAGQEMADKAQANVPTGSPLSYQVNTPEKGRYIFDNLPTAVARTDENGMDVYFLAGYKVELAETNDTSRAKNDPWHLTSLYQYAPDADGQTQEESDANVLDLDDAAATMAGDYRILKRYTENGTTALRGNDGLVIPSTALTADEAAAVSNPLAKLDVNAGDAMDTTGAATYRWTAPLTYAEAGDVGEIAPAYAAIAGYVWCDNNYRDGTYSFTATTGTVSYTHLTLPTMATV